MKKIFPLFIFLLMTTGVPVTAQELPAIQGKEPLPITPREMFVLSHVPQLELPADHKGPNAPLIPFTVDNSKYRFFRAITQQYGYECGQSAGIAFNFTYEIDRLRNLAANTPATTYPTHFTWDFLNDGDNYTGASFFDSWEIVRACGNMNVEEYGGTLGYGGSTRWISGYNVYYSGMHNRLTSVKAIRADTPEGLQTLKYWIYDHTDGSTFGGVGNIYGSYFCTPSDVLPPGTPEAGKYVQTQWGSYASHAYTICGFNDSIRFDFNNDGQYTNTIDINGDGEVDMHDWEIGGLKLANGYAGPGCSNGGFCYTMYKNVADAIEYGGIWNHTIYVLDVKEDCDPQLTMKIKLKHTSREKLKVTVGINPDITATIPSYVQNYPIFNFQGGNYYMQGGTTEADKTIEFGLDLTPLIDQVDNGVPARWFLQVEEDDPSGSDAGEIVTWSIMDYSAAIPIETNYPGSHITLQNNTTTRTYLNYTLDVDRPVITTDTLVPGPLYQPYDALLTATEGTPPYHWDVKFQYPETTGHTGFPAVTAEQLTLTNSNSGYAIKTLDFDFPFYGKTVNKLYIYADGYILFDDQPYHYPYQIDDMLLFKETRIISPFMADMAVYASSNQGIWYEGNPDYAIIRWKTSIYNMQGNTGLNFAVKLYADGTIEWYYGDMVYPSSISWTGGLSGGDNKNYQFSLYNGASTIPQNMRDAFASCHYPTEISLSEDGHLTGTPTRAYYHDPIHAVVTDNNNISATRILHFSSSGLFVDPTIISGGDSLIEFGETAEMNLRVSNIGDEEYSNVILTVHTDDPWIQLTDSILVIPVIHANEMLNLPQAFSFEVSGNVPDRHAFTMTLHGSGSTFDFQQILNMVAYAPRLAMTGSDLLDGDNGMLDPGESADIQLVYKNSGGAKATGITVHISSLDSNLSISPDSANIALLSPDSSQTLVFHVTASQDAAFLHLYQFVSSLTADQGYAMADTLWLLSGQITEDFETGDFSKFPWSSTGQWPWALQSDAVYDGQYAARSGDITDNAESMLHLSVNVLSPGELSFWKYVSCEHDGSGNVNYDYLSFKIDGFELGRWDGIVPWTKFTCQVPAGYHTFSWIYHKDYSVSTGWDGCLVDAISFPLIEGALPQLAAGPSSIEHALHPGETVADTIQVTNTGGGIMDFSVVVFDTAAINQGYAPENINTSFLSCNTSQLVPGQNFNWILTAHNGSTDNEGIKHIKLDFPGGFPITGVTNFTGGSLGELVLQGTPGMGNTFNWHGETTAGKGVLKAGENATSSVTGSIPATFMNDVFAVYTLTGDSIGGEPHQTTGHIKITNAGLGNDWLTLDPATGTLTHDQSTLVLLTIDATGLVQKTYQCNVVVRDYYNNKVVIPVTLDVSYPVGTGDPENLSATKILGCTPNPFTGSTVITYRLKEVTDVQLTLCDLQGHQIGSCLRKAERPGDHAFTWNGTANDGLQVAPGIYFCQMKTIDYQGYIKMIRIR